MKPLFAISKITILSSTRSYVFQVLLGILLVGSILLPFLLTGDGTPISHIKVSIDYTIYFISTILILSTLWISCSIMNQDLDQYQMHIVSVKPVTKMKIWLGKFLGILIIHTILLIFSFIAFYAFLTYDIKSSNYSKNDVTQIKNTILTGRNKVFPDTSYITNMFHKKWEEKQKEIKKSGKELTKTELNKFKNSTLYQTITQSGQVEPHKSKIFKFLNYNKSIKNISLKFRIFVGDPNLIARQNKPTTKGQWEIFNYSTSKFDIMKSSKKTYTSNIFYSISIPSEQIPINKPLKLQYTNNSNGSVFFQLTESPIIFVHETSFFLNYFRGFIVTFLLLIVVTVIGCSLGSIFSFPIAIFVFIAYLLAGSVSSYIIASETSQYTERVSDNFGTTLSQSLLKAIIPLNKFDISEKLSNGTLVNYSYIWNLIFYLIILKEIPFAIICIYLYSKKELGLIIKK